jgi:hypothetical protein
VITNGTSRKVAHVRAGSPRAVVAQVDRARWLSLEGVPVVSDDPERVAEAVRRYALRYRQPAENPRASSSRSPSTGCSAAADGPALRAIMQSCRSPHAARAGPATRA